MFQNAKPLEAKVTVRKKLKHNPKTWCWDTKLISHWPWFCSYTTHLTAL